jgi:fumarylacetoacetase
LDYELEVGFFIGRGNQLGQTIPIAEAEENIFGLCLVNDWSARDLQRWEYQPLGPFLAKSFATTVSPWVITMEALAPYRCGAFERAEGDPAPLEYLCDGMNASHGGVDLKLEVFLASAEMRKRGLPSEKLSCANFSKMYWTMAQMLTHHASNGCNLRPGDLLASGTVSGPDRRERGCLFELTWNGDSSNPLPGTDRTPIRLPSGEARTFLEDGDEVSFRGYCLNQQFRRIGFGECTGRIVPAAK